MKKIYAAATALILASSALAQTEVMYISMKDGSTQTLRVADIAGMTFGEEAEPSLAEQLAGEYTGTNTMAVGTLATYTVDLKPVITANEDGSVNFTYPQSEVSNTIMGNLTLGTLTISNIPYVESENAFYLDYSEEGLTQHFTCVNTQGATSMDSDYVLGAGSTIKIEVAEGGIKVTNPFKLGAMPFPLTATFEGTK